MGSNTMDKVMRTRLIIGCIIIGAVSLFVWFFSYINEPIGDDLLCYYEGALTFYLDDYENTLGNKLTNLPQIMRALKFCYMHWSGRMTGYFINYIGKLLPKIAQALLTAAVFTTNILLAMRIVYKDWVKTLSSPLMFGIIFLASYWCRSSVLFSYMWTMVSIYSYGIMLCLLYYNLSVVSYRQEKYYPIWLLQLIGFFAGFSHEVISFCLMSVIGTVWMIRVISKEEKWTSIFRHLGLGMGYLLCFFAPGNFYRQTQSHDVISTTYIERLKDSFDVHMSALKGTKGSCLILTVCLILAYTTLVLLMDKHKKAVIKAIIDDVVPLFAGGGASILVWAIAPHTQMYGMDFWILMVYIILLRVMTEFPLLVNRIEWYSISIVCATMIMALFVGLYSKEIWNYSIVSVSRRALAKEAAENNEEQVKVPRFDDSLPGDRYLLSYLNAQEQYDNSYYVGYYRTRLIIQNLE